MLLPNNPEVDVQAADEKLSNIAVQRRRARPLFGSAPSDAGSKSSAGVSLAVKERPAIWRFMLGLYRRIREILAPGLHWKQRVVLIPVLGSVAVWLYALIRLQEVNQNTAIELAQLRQFEEAAKNVLAQFNYRLNQLEDLQIERRLNQFDAIDIAARLNQFDALQIEQRLNEFDALQIEQRLSQFDALQIEQRLNQFDAIDIAARLNQFDKIDIAARLNQFDALQIEQRLNQFDAIDIAARLNQFDKIDIAARLNQFDALQIEQRLNQFDAIDIAARLNQFDAIDIAARLNQFDKIDIAVRLKHLDQFADATGGATITLNNRVAGITRELRQLTVPAKASLSPLMALPAATESAATDSFYIDFEDTFRGSSSDISERFKVYLPYLDKFSGDTSAQVLDIGCGRGEWLALLGQHDIKASGIDLNRAMVDACREVGLQAQCTDALDYLRRQSQGSLAAVTGFHIIEHLPFEFLLALLDAALRALRPDGLLIFETPNPENLVVGACNFYSDPTHLHPIVPAVAEFMARQRGFAHAEILRLHPYPESHRLTEDSALAKRFNDAFYGPQDYALLAWKTHAN